MGIRRDKSVVGYLRRPPGKHSFGNGLELIVSPLGKSSWRLRIRALGKDKAIRLDHASAFHNLNWARARADELRLNPASTGSDMPALGGAMAEWSARNLATRRSSQRHHHKTLKRIKKHPIKLWDVRVDQLDRRSVVDRLEQIKDIDTAGCIYYWIREALETLVDRGVLFACSLGRKPESLTLKKSATSRPKSYGQDYASLASLYRAIAWSNPSRSVRLAAQTST